MGHTEYYEFLGVAPGDSDEAIKKAYRRLALKHHPDKNGDPEKFRKLTEVYEVLKDPGKRQAYDRFGSGGPRGTSGADPRERHCYGQSFPTAFSVEEVFGSMFGGFQDFQARPATDSSRKRAKQIRHTVLLSMEEMYAGKKLRIAVDRAIICSKCRGEGGKDISERPCVPCAGRGLSTTSHGSIFQSSVRCQACDATGKVRKVGEPCGACKSTGVGTERIVLEPVVNPGDRPNTSFVFRGKGDFISVKGGSIVGDVVVTTVQKPCSKFTRKGHDLHTTIQISLKDSLSGFTTAVKHLDGRMIEISVPRGKVTVPGTVVNIKGEGIPRNKGTLFVTIGINFPARFSDSSIEMLDVLPELN